jgi:hypothetical protein
MKNIIKSFCFITILLILLAVFMYTVFPKNNISKYSLLDLLDYEILEEKDDTIDVLFVGDSLVYSSVSPMEIWKEYGFTSFDCSTPAQLLETSYKYIKIAIERQHPKVIFLEANVLFRDAKKRTFIRKVKDIKDRYSLLTEYHDNWKDLINYGEIINSNKGYYYINKVNKAKDIPYMKKNKKNVYIPEENKDYLDKIIKLCEQNNIKLYFFGVPSMNSWNKTKVSIINELSKELNIPFIDLNTDNILKINWKTETKDEGSHLNYKGAKKVSTYLGSIIKESNLVENHKDDKEYEDWKKSYNKYERIIEFY